MDHASRALAIALLSCSCARPQPAAAVPVGPPPAAVPPAAGGSPDPVWVEGLTLARPGEHILEPQRTDAFVSRAREEGSTALVVLVDGKLVVEEYFGGSRDYTAFAMSVTKSVAALAIGVLHDRDLLQLDAPLSSSLVPEWQGGDKASVTLRHLLTHTSGLDTTRYGDPDHWLDGSIEAHGLAAPVAAAPDTTFVYNNQAADFLSVVARRADPDRLFLDDLLDRDVFGPLGITGAHWKKDGHGHPRAAGELLIRPIDLAKIGQLVLDEGTWNGRRIVSAAWIERMLAPGTPLYAGCGLLWWRDGDDERALAFRADGYLGQYIIVVPKARLVAVRMRDPMKTSWDPAEKTWPDFVWDVLSLSGIDVPADDRNAFARAPR